MSRRNTWPPALQARLVELAAQGLTTTEIGSRLGLSKNAVIGRAHRTGVQLRGPNTGSSSASIKASWADPEIRAKRIAGSRRAWADPELRRRHSILVKAGLRKRAEARATGEPA